MLEQEKCPICKKIPVQPINLKCEHHPCFACASKIITVDTESQLETKYKIVCPSCRKKTLTYDIRHLIISITEQDEDIYVTTKYIDRKPQLYMQKNQNFADQRVTQSFGHSKKNSIQSIISSSKSCIDVECRIHPGQHIQYFCYDCHKKNYKNVFQCSQCFKKHKSEHKHKVLTVRQGLEKIHSHNKAKVQKGIPSKKKDIQYMQQSWTLLQETINNEYEKIYKQLNDEFKNIYQLISEKYENTRKALKNQFLKQSEEIKSSLEINKKLKESFKSLEKMQSASQDPQSQINFYIYYRQIEDAIDLNSSKITKNIDLPKLTKKTTLLRQVLSEFIEVNFGADPGSTGELALKNHSRHLSYGNSPMGSARCINGSEKYESSRKGNVEESWKVGKQNINVKAMTPKAGLFFDFNKLTL